MEQCCLRIRKNEIKDLLSRHQDCCVLAIIFYHPQNKAFSYVSLFVVLKNYWNKKCIYCLLLSCLEFQLPTILNKESPIISKTASSSLRRFPKQILSIATQLAKKEKGKNLFAFFKVTTMNEIGE